MGSIYKVVQWPVSQLIGEIDQGTIRLPDLQRPFVWPAVKVRDLLDSIYRGYPVGELMFWDSREDAQSRAIGTHAQLSGRYQIIDGQQRITSLYASLKGRDVRDSDYRRKRIRIGFNPASERFEVTSAAIDRSPDWVHDVADFFDAQFRVRKRFLSRLRHEPAGLSDADEEHIEEVFERLAGMQNYQFSVVHIQGGVERQRVADVFVRINSQGTRLSPHDYILTWLSVFWPAGRERIEAFARDSRMSPREATQAEGHPVRWTALNPFIRLTTRHIVRVLIAIGQNRARMLDAYAALQARDRATGKLDGARQQRELEKLQRALPVVLDPVSWTEFVRSVQLAGFRSQQGVTSQMNLLCSYVMFLLGRTRFHVEMERLRRVVARWLFMSQLTGRYTGSAETRLQRDLARVQSIPEGDGAGFERALESVIATTLTEDFWSVTLPANLETSAAALSPAYQCYLAALVDLSAEMLMLPGMSVEQWMDSGRPTVKGLEIHHLFPRDYLQTTLRITDPKRVNQVANFAPADWHTNELISNSRPADYWPRLVGQRAKGRADGPRWLKRQMRWHALPDGWERMGYDEFLDRRRAQIAGVIRSGFDAIGGGTASAAAGQSEQFAQSQARVGTGVTVQQLLDQGVLHAGDALELGGDAGVDAQVSEHGSLVVTREDQPQEFDSLDDAAASAGVTNVDGVDAWGIQSGGEFTPVSALLASHRQAPAGRD